MRLDDIPVTTDFMRDLLVYFNVQNSYYGLPASAGVVEALYGDYILAVQEKDRREFVLSRVKIFREWQAAWKKRMGEIVEALRNPDITKEEALALYGEAINMEDLAAEIFEAAGQNYGRRHFSIIPTQY